ncbi:MAG: hypothetical protein EZS28_009121 [Streblomastix strix]|uniref:NrS-1 polymerase-like helicase domain-containing protein n=1 Tax=Streblomastix strix TaxID=222440 RepID=A0A5J4WM61_9EUKA|nr:MAG: hypothetical protein EZS28_009121 [Streblomastix strix]
MQTSETSQQIKQSFKSITLEKGPKRKYTRKSKTDDKAKAMIEQMINEQTNEQVNEQTNESINEQINEQTNEQTNESIIESVIEPTIEMQTRPITETNVQEVMQSMIEVFGANALTIRERTKGAIFDTHNYKKCSKGKYITESDKVTGSCLDINRMNDDQLTIIDFDLPHNLDKYNKEFYQIHIVKNLLPKGTPVLITAHGGLHAYVNRNNYPLKGNRLVASKKIPFDGFTVDIFAQIDKHKMSDGKPNGIKENRVMLPDSIIHDDDYEQTKIEHKYPPAPEGFWDSSLLPSLWDILASWNVDLREEEYVKEPRVIQADGTSTLMSIDLVNAIIDGFQGIEIHNYASKSIDECTLLPLFNSLNSLVQFGISNDQINELYDKIYKIANLTTNASAHWNATKTKLANDVGFNKPWLIVSYVKNFNRKYYEDTLQKCIADYFQQQEEEKRKKQKIQLMNSANKQLINLKGPFLLMSDIQEKAIKGEYKDESELMQDLMRVMCYTTASDGSAMYMVKQWDSASGVNIIRYMSEQNVRSLLNKVVWKKNKKTYDIFHEYNHLFHKIGIKFYSKNPNEFSIFQGLKYSVLDTVDMSVIEQFLGLVKDTIAGDDEIVYEYILNWLAWIVQNIGEKSGVAPVLIGPQGIGKNRFIDAISELFAGYSVPNISDMSKLTGAFNAMIEDKIISIQNEINNIGTGNNKRANSDKLKTLITEKYVVISQKYIPDHMSESPTNFILVSNNSRPVWVEQSDRRFVICECKGPHREDFDYFDRLSKGYTPEFYDNLTTFLTFRDISKFNIHNIPMTAAKIDMMIACRSQIDEFIVKHYDQLVAGVACSTVLSQRPQTYQEKYFIRDLQSHCVRKQKRMQSKQTWIYILKEDSVKIYKRMSEEQKSRELSNEVIDEESGYLPDEVKNEGSKSEEDMNEQNKSEIEED